MYAIKSKIFFLADASFLGDCLRFGYIYFLLPNVFHEVGGHLRLELSCIQVIWYIVISENSFSN